MTTAGKEIELEDSPARQILEGRNVAPQIAPPKKGLLIIIKGVLAASLATSGIGGGAYIILSRGGGEIQPNPANSSPAVSHEKVVILFPGSDGLVGGEIDMPSLSSEKTDLSPAKPRVLKPATNNEVVTRLKAVEPTKTPLPPSTPEVETIPAEISTSASSESSLTESPTFTHFEESLGIAQRVANSVFAEDFYADNGELQPQLIEEIEFLRRENSQMAGELANWFFNLLIKISQEGIDDQRLAVCQRMKDLIVALGGTDKALDQALSEYLASLLPNKAPAAEPIKQSLVSIPTPAATVEPQPEMSSDPDAKARLEPTPLPTVDFQPQPQASQNNVQKTGEQSQTDSNSEEKQEKKPKINAVIGWSPDAAFKFMNNVVGHDLLGVTTEIPSGRYAVMNIQDEDLFGLPVKTIYAVGQGNVAGHTITFLQIVKLAGKPLKIGDIINPYGVLEETTEIFLAR